MSRPQFVLEADDTEDQRLRSSELPRYSEDSIDELALDRSVFEKDERFRDEGKMEQGEEEEDEFLYGKVPSRKQPRKPFIALLLIILALAALIGIFSARSFKAPTWIKKGGNKHITMDHVFNGTFAIKSKRIDWVKEATDGVYSHRTDEGDIVLQDASKPDYEEVLLNATDVREATGNQLMFQDWRLSADMRYVALKTDHRKLWRHSSYGNFYIHRLSDHKTFSLRLPSHPAEIAYVDWSPTSHSIAYVYKNNLYVVPAKDLDKLETAGQVPEAIQVTKDGSDTIFNGVPDWVYEEEVFSNNFAFWWSPQSEIIAYLRSDETEVKDYTLQYYNPNGAAFDPQPYPENFVMKYPKPGTPNPIVTVHMFSLQGHLASASAKNSTKQLQWEGSMPLDKRIIAEVSWLGSEELLVKEVDRSAKKGNIVLFTGGRAQGKVVRTLGKEGEEGDDGWIDHNQQAIPVKGTDGYLDIVPTKDGYNHIAFFPTLDSSDPIFVTEGEWEVADGIAGVDQNRKLVYFLAASPTTERHLYQARLPSTGALDDFASNMTALTDTSVPGYHSASFSPRSGFYLLNYLGPDIPKQTLVTVDEPGLDVVIEDNAKLNATSSEFCMPIRTHSVIQSDGVDINVVETLPPNFEASGRKKYPVLLNPYGGPGSQSVNQKFARDWSHHLVCEHKIIVLTVDGRGTGFKGRSFRNWVRDDLGRYETIDQINAAKEWAKRRYIDNKRIGIWGWSFGGFLTSKVIEADSGIFTLGMAVAPVTNWLYYDSIYTERYMSTPEENELGYVNSAVNNVTAFEHADFLLAHGSGDDNVHYANTANLLEKFTQAQVRGFRFRMFTDSDHSMSGFRAYREVYEFMTAFLDEKWSGNRKVHD
ncbi:dipeptidyl-peptidase [Filobasidium floriforme]|uniref:dipeptidyl-peptidase n=1 Tax=Filobasidium floriforme TaxID=5210 RepID=UPI001E8D984F|nr:dipeptidyl-peptidase [Filobasidium floriforme]KAH8081110.1 dipeptidyl-peptidase [Filobasidium floriforme]